MSLQAKADLVTLNNIEKRIESLNDTLWALAKKYNARMTTPYAEENIGDVRRAIEAVDAHEEEHQRWNIAKDLEINDQCAGLYEDTPIVVDGETVGQWAGGGMSPEAYLKYLEDLKKLDKED